MAITTGLLASSIRARISWNFGGPLPRPDAASSSSLISAPAMNVLPPPMMTMARADASFSAASKAATRPSGTPGLSAFTGGLLMVMTATPSCVVRFTSFSIVVIPLPRGRGSVVAERSSQLLYCGWDLDQRRAGHAIQDTGVGEGIFDVAAGHARMFARQCFGTAALPALDGIHDGAVVLVRNGKNLRRAGQLGTHIDQRAG